MKVGGQESTVLNNMYICSKDNNRCMYNSLLLAKELYTGCEELVNEEVMHGVMNNPEYTTETNNINLKASENRNPVG